MIGCFTYTWVSLRRFARFRGLLFEFKRSGRGRMGELPGTSTFLNSRSHGLLQLLRHGDSSWAEVLPGRRGSLELNLRLTVW